MKKHKYIPIVWQLSVFQLTNNRTLFSGVILNNAPFIYDKKIGAFRNLLKVLKSYSISAYAQKKIIIVSGETSIQTNTDKHGGFQIIADFQHNESVDIRIDGVDKPLDILQSYPIVFRETTSIFDIISDIDDTIIVSYTSDILKRIGTIAFKAPQKRKVIEFTRKIFTEFNKLDANIYYVSKSESNLFAMLTAFIEHNELPKGALFLTPYLKLNQLIKPNKGPDFKLNNIRFLIRNTEDKNYVLFGDDSQRDMEIYTTIAKEFPKRILKIYIRQTKTKVLPRQKRLMEALKSTAVPVRYFKSDDILNISNELIQLKNK